MNTPICTSCQQTKFDDLLAGLVEQGIYTQGQEPQQLIIDAFQSQNPCTCVRVPMLKAKVKLANAGLYATAQEVPDAVAEGVVLAADKHGYTTAEYEAALAAVENYVVPTVV